MTEAPEGWGITPDQISLPDLLGVPFAAIPPEEVIPLWPGWIPRRHVTLVVAPGGSSKGLWSIDDIARVTTGRAWPGEPSTAVHEPEAVVLVAPEDDPNEAVAWRLKAAGADTSLVFNLTVLPDGSPFILPNSVGTLHDTMVQVTELTGRPVGLVVIDPLMATVERSISSNIAARKVVGPLEKLARDGYKAQLGGQEVKIPGPAVVLTHHTVKSGAAAGSKGLTDAMRHVLTISLPPGADKKTPVRVLTVDKSNMAQTGTQLRYVLAGDGNDVHVVYPLDSTPAVSRGYTIATDSSAVYKIATGQEPPVISSAGTAASQHTWQIRVAVKGQKGEPAKVGDGFTSEKLAKDAAEQDAGHALQWRGGDHGSLYAATIVKGGQVAAYTVFPNAA